MNISIGNLVIIITLIIAGGIMIWQFIQVNNTSDEDDGYWVDDVEETEDTIDETEEFMRRLDRLTKRNRKDDDDKKR